MTADSFTPEIIPEAHVDTPSGPELKGNFTTQDSVKYKELCFAIASDLVDQMLKDVVAKEELDRALQESAELRVQMAEKDAVAKQTLDEVHSQLAAKQGKFDYLKTLISNLIISILEHCEVLQSQMAAMKDEASDAAAKALAENVRQQAFHEKALFFANQNIAKLEVRLADAKQTVDEVNSQLATKQGKFEFLDILISNVIISILVYCEALQSKMAVMKNSSNAIIKLKSDMAKLKCKLYASESYASLQEMDAKEALELAQREIDWLQTRKNEVYLEVDRARQQLRLEMAEKDALAKQTLDEVHSQLAAKQSKFDYLKTLISNLIISILEYCEALQSQMAAMKDEARDAAAIALAENALQQAISEEALQRARQNIAKLEVHMAENDASARNALEGAHADLAALQGMLKCFVSMNKLIM